VREAFGDQRARDARADNQRIAFQIFNDLRARRMPRLRKPRRTAAAQVCLFGIVWIESADCKPLTTAAGRSNTDGRASPL
jgi:hypothetical protein